MNRFSISRYILSSYLGLSLVILILSCIYISQNFFQKKPANLYQSSIDCVSKECTVSPVDLEASKKSNYSNLIPAYTGSEIDFSNLDEALKAVKGQDGAQLLLLAGRDDKKNDRHILKIHTSSTGIEPVVINSSVHLRGELANDLMFKMPKIVALEERLIDEEYVRQRQQFAYNLCIEASQKPFDYDSWPPGPNGGKQIPGIWGMYQLKLQEKGFYDGKGSSSELCHQIVEEEIPSSMIGNYKYSLAGLLYQPLLYFSNIGHSANNRSSIDGLLFDQKMMMIQDQDISYYNNIDNMIPVIRVENSILDIKNCYFYSAWNSDVNEVQMPTDISQVRKNRIAAAIYENSQGEIKNNAVIGFWAGGFLAKDSALVLKNNQMRGRWFAVAGINSNIKMSNNAIYTIDGRTHMGNPNAGGWRGLKQQYPDWIGPLPVSDYPDIGVWLKGGDIVMENNTIGEHNATVSLSSVSSGKIEKNVWIYGDSGGVMAENSSGVVINNNITIQDGYAYHDNFDLTTCATAFMSNIGDLPICMVLPKPGSQVSQNQAGFTFGVDANNWNEWKLIYPQVGCTSLIQTYFLDYVCADDLVCDQNSGQCLKPEEDSGDQPESSDVPNLPPNFNLNFGNTGHR